MNLNPGVSASLLAGSEISPRVWLQVPGIPELVSDHWWRGAGPDKAGCGIRGYLNLGPPVGRMGMQGIVGLVLAPWGHGAGSWAL